MLALVRIREINQATTGFFSHLRYPFLFLRGHCTWDTNDIMKKILAIAILGIFATLSVAHGATEFTKDLLYGMTGSDQVIQLQKFLTDQKLYSGPITGNFYSLTKKAVIAFQKAHGINGTGYFGPLARAKANQILDSVVAIQAQQTKPTSQQQSNNS